MEGPALDQLGGSSTPPTGRSSPAAASGRLEDLDALAGLESGGRRLAGAIVGRALYEGRFTLAEALDRVAP